MPTDGTFALEILPPKKRHLLTSLSIFFSIGSVVAAFVALMVIPGNSCPPTSTTSSPCDVQTENKGWKYMILILTFITAAMFLARILFFRLHESPRFLVHTGREVEAAIALTDIAKFNGSRLQITVADVKDDEEDDSREAACGPLRIQTQHEEEREGLLEHSSTPPMYRPVSPSKSVGVLRQLLEAPLNGWYCRMQGLLTGEWKQRTLLVWGIWMSMALAFTMFNVFLPTFLEYRSGENSASESSGEPSSLSGPLWEVVIFTLGGCPGALVGAYLIDAAPRYHMSKSLVLALVTFVTAAFSLAFVMVSGYYVVMITTIGISLTSTAMWSILYGMTPELFITEVRGTASGTASALSRVGGIMAPLIGGILVSINPSLVVLASVAIFMVAVLLLVWLDQALKRSTGPSPMASASQTP